MDFDVRNPINVTAEAMQQVGQSNAQELRAEQQSSKISFLADVEDNASFGALFRTAERQKTQNPPRTRVQELLETEAQQVILPVEEIAENFQKKNPELKKKSLLSLFEEIKPEDTKEEILRKIKSYFLDVTLIDEVLDFLLETTTGELNKQVKEAKEEFLNQNRREIIAGKNIAEEARAASSQGLGTATSLRDMYRDITGNPRDSTTLFDELSKKYSFKDLKKVVTFLLNSLGADLKSKGPSIERGNLHNLLSETRSLQAVLGVYRFFNSRTRLINYLFNQAKIPLPQTMNFESLSKEFMNLVRDRYPSPDKVLQTTVTLKIEKWIQAKIIALSQFRDAIKEVAVNQIYRSFQHRDELLFAILEALEDLEDSWEEAQQQQKEKDDEKEEEQTG